MKKLLCLFIMTLTMSIIGMELEPAIPFKLSKGIVAIPERNLPFITTLHNHYLRHKQKADVEGIVPLLNNVSAHAVKLVNDALNVGAYKFAEHYNSLSADDRTLLVKAAKQYGDDGTTVMLDVPELRKQIDALSCVKSDDNNDDREYVKNYFKEKLICNKASVFGWLSKTNYGKHMTKVLLGDIAPSSFLLNGYHTHDQTISTIPLRINGIVHQTAGSCFITDTYECRVTDVRDKHCMLWVVNHNDASGYVSTGIRHKGAIKGCVFSKTQAGVGYVVTYSESDIVFSIITTHKDKEPVIESVNVDLPQGGIVVDACFDHQTHQFLVATHEPKNLNSVFRRWSMDGQLVHKVAWSFKEYAFIEKILVYRDSLALFFSLGDKYALHKYERLSDGTWESKSVTTLCDKFTKEDPSWNRREWIDFMPRGESVFMYYAYEGPLSLQAEALDAKSNKQSDDIFGDFMNIFTSQPATHNEKYYVYSPGGLFLLRNSLKKEIGIWRVKTELLDAVTHKQILSLDTFLENFKGIGFSPSGDQLIFFGAAGVTEKVDLLSNQDLQCLQALEGVAFKDAGVTSLLKRLCEECRENGVITLRNDSPTYAMLHEWSKNSADLKELLEKCLPPRVQKVGGQKK
jgi:hypothetical protein